MRETIVAEIKSPLFLGSKVVGKTVKQIRRVFLGTIGGDPQLVIRRIKNKMIRNTQTIEPKLREIVNENLRK